MLFCWHLDWLYNLDCEVRAPSLEAVLVETLRMLLNIRNIRSFFQGRSDNGDGGDLRGERARKQSKSVDAFVEDLRGRKEGRKQNERVITLRPPPQAKGGRELSSASYRLV